MHSNILLKFLSFTCLLMILLSCNRQAQEITPLVGQSTSISVEQAQQWYENYAAIQSRARTSVQIRYSPLWTSAQLMRLSNGVVAISVPLQYEKGYGLGKGGQTKLLFFKDTKGHYQAQLLQIISDVTYLNAKKGRVMQQDFSGIVLMKDLEENFLNGVRYVEGKITGEVSPASSNAGARIAGMCQEVRIEYYVDVCIGKNCGGQRLDYVDVYYVCTSGGNGSGGVSSSNTGAAIGGGGGNSGNEYVGGAPESDRVDGEGRATVVRDPSQRIHIPGIENPGIDLKSFLDCFGSVQTSDFVYNLTVYVEEPIPGNNSSMSLSGNVGHTCIGLTKTDRYNPANSISQIIGFYPAESKKTLTLSPVASEMHNNGDSNPDRRTKYTISSNYEVSPQSFEAAIQAAAELASMPYDLDDNNCTDYVMNIMNRAGVSIPQNTGDILVSSGHNPGQLGYDLRQLQGLDQLANINTSVGLTIPGKGSCY